MTLSLEIIDRYFSRFTESDIPFTDENFELIKQTLLEMTDDGLIRSYTLILH